MKLREIAEVLRAELGPQAHRVTTRNVPDWAVRVAALFNPVARPVEQSIADTARCLIERGIVRV